MSTHVSTRVSTHVSTHVRTPAVPPQYTCEYPLLVALQETFRFNATAPDGTGPAVISLEWRPANATGAV